MIEFLVGCLVGLFVGGLIMNWYNNRPSEFDQWRKELYEKRDDDGRYTDVSE